MPPPTWRKNGCQAFEIKPRPSRRREAADRPRAKAVVELQGCRSRRSWGASTKKRVDLGSLCHIEHETAPPFVDAPQQRAFPKVRCDVTDRKASPDAPDLFFGILFWSSRPEHNQKPTTDTANRHCSLIPTRRKIAVFPQGGQSTAPLARGRSCPTVLKKFAMLSFRSIKNHPNRPA